MALSDRIPYQAQIDRPKLTPLVKLRRGEPLLLIDIAVPRDIDPEVNLLQDVFLYNIDDLQAIAADYLKQRQQEIAHCEEIIREKTRGLLTTRPLTANEKQSGLSSASSTMHS